MDSPAYEAQDFIHSLLDATDDYDRLLRDRDTPARARLQTTVRDLVDRLHQHVHSGSPGRQPRQPQSLGPHLTGAQPPTPDDPEDPEEPADPENPKAGEDEGEGGDREDEGQKGREKPPPKSHIQALERFETLCKHATLPPLTVHEFIQYLKTIDTHATREDREDRALAILVRGLGEVDCNEQWWTEFDIYVEQTQACDADTQASTILELVDLDLTRRLCRSHRALATHHKEFRAQNFSQFFYHQILTMTFAMSWAQLSGKGSKKTKKNFFQSLYNEYTEDFVPSDKLSQPLSLPKFVTAQNIVITPRNRLVELYKQFGIGVLANPFWSLAGTTSNQFSPSFPRLLKLLLEDIPQVFLQVNDETILPAPISAVRYAGTNEAVLGLASALGPEAIQSLTIFTSNYPDSVDLTIVAAAQTPSQ
ncbi:hypothetical protein K438DRAFT_2028449 [Mycena galopus ATCC 62051]|nr:hypothetical protein K438DRAFT_2028449 [Mycena galopus ATCC 62051]